MTDEQNQLLRAIQEAPDEWTAKLVYADWLQENDEPEHAFFIRSFAPGARFR